MLFIFVTSLLAWSNVKNTSPNVQDKAITNKLQQSLYYGGDIITMEGDKAAYVESVIEQNGKIIFTRNKASLIHSWKSGLRYLRFAC